MRFQYKSKETEHEISMSDDPLSRRIGELRDKINEYLTGLLVAQGESIIEDDGAEEEEEEM
jgi:hypothetical protein